MSFVRVSLVLIVLATVGCSSGGPAPVSVNPPAQAGAADNVKSILEGVSQSGELGSGAEELRTALKEMNNTDLLTDVDALESTTDPAAAKAKAKEMLGKL